jgi:hypothetical protein
VSAAPTVVVDPITANVRASDAPGAPGGHDDRGAILVLVLLAGVIATLFVLPMLYYVSTVTKANSVPTDKAEAVELSEGGVWVALSHQADLYDMCTGGELPSSLGDVTTTCDVIATETLRDAAAMPFHVATVQADAAIPAEVTVPNPYANPNTAANPAAWLGTPDWASSPTAGTVWLPQLPVRAASGGGARDVSMLPGAQDPNYSSCRVFFPGTFTSPIEISGPTYFTSGVYYFTQPIVLKSGADVVVGNGAEVGCTNDPEAIAGANPLPNPLNMSGLGGTFVFGDAARIEIDDDGSDDIRFVMNQRYVSDEETGVAASSNVSIVSVNGTHAPFAAGEALGDDLSVAGVIHVPASTIGVDGDPLAADEGYVPSRLSPKPSPPSAPVVTSTVSHQRDRSGNGGPANRGRLTVFWDAPADNGSPITGYTATDSVSGRSCSPAVRPGYEIQTSCTITGLTNQSSASGLHPIVTVTASNAAGTSAPSEAFDADRIDLGGNDQVPSADVPGKPDNQAAANHSDGIAVSWDAPGDDGGSPITGYRVTATDQLLGGTLTCDAWWNETMCVLPGTGLVPGLYDIEIVALQSEGAPAVEHVGDARDIDDHLYALGTTAAPDTTPTLPPSERTAILDFTVEHNAEVTVSIAGYVSVPQGRIALSSASPVDSKIALTGGVIAGEIDVDPAAVPTLDIRFDNPIAQKRIRIVSVADRDYTATSTAVVQVNKSGSMAINSWIVQ